jgi:DNA-binding XRE family transcriptional regulator
MMPRDECHVREYRQKAGLTQAELGRWVGVSAQTISNIERGSEPKVRLAMAIADALQTPLDVLFNRPGTQVGQRRQRGRARRPA